MKSLLWGADADEDVGVPSRRARLELLRAGRFFSHRTEIWPLLKKFELFEAVPALNECMKPIDPLERSGVWLEIQKCYRARENLRIFLAKNQSA